MADDGMHTHGMTPLGMAPLTVHTVRAAPVDDYAAKMRAKRGVPLPAPKVPVDLPFSPHSLIGYLCHWPAPNPTGEVRSYIEDELRHLRRRLPRTHDGVRARIEGQVSALMDVLRRL